jgi:hypothetical protein
LGVVHALPVAGEVRELTAHAWFPELGMVHALPVVAEVLALTVHAWFPAGAGLLVQPAGRV